MDNDDYIVQPSKGTERSRAYGWSVGFGLQRADGLMPSEYARSTAQANIVGEIDYQTVGAMLRDYHAANPDERSHMEADIVASRISQLLQSPTFSFAPAALRTIHRFLFADALNPDWVGVWRNEVIVKQEPVLLGKSVAYAAPADIEPTLDYDFQEERKRQRDYDRLSDQQTADSVFAFVSGIWQIHPFREGNTRTCAVFAIQYLRFLGFTVDNRPFQDHAQYFRDALALCNASSRILRSSDELQTFEQHVLFGADEPLPDLRALAAQRTDITDTDPDDLFNGIARRP
ncbi:Fic family protein [Bifidobacterium eulemuris]|uniref:protein adenylyltransferase n=1 Tax=Bifidobacterium eulemuris TaxID=1765219 RepID=A0A261G907_9BIFI|nr:Fic family protein [Bifidobacterium eulemuris]OZG67693.1 filamentation induced by cAMP protein fic [Bifidobacterium eulemuris]QOL31600.1 Fic family protein [Bifidobacterium eulemuris]